MTNTATASVTLPPMTEPLNPRFAPATRLLWNLGVLGALEAIARAGFGAAEVWATHLEASDTSAVAVAQAARELGLRLSLHAPSYDLNPLSSNREIRAVSRRQVLGCFEVARVFNAEMVVVHPGSLSSTTDSEEDYWLRLGEYTQELNAHAQSLDLEIGIEGMERKRLQFVTELSALQRLAKLLEAAHLERVGIVLDVAHAFTMGKVMDFIQNTPRVVHVHLSDSAKTKTHALLGEGELPLAKIIPLLLRQFPGLIAIEGRYAANEIRALERAVEVLKKLKV
jgi:sugar phosphate isomerase/epimerase